MQIKGIITLLIGVCISTLLFLISPDTMAADAEQQILEKISTLENQITDWQHEAYFVGLLAILIAVAGGTVTLLQGASNRYAKIAVAALGIFVISLVTTQEQFFPNSRKEIYEKISNATKKVDEVKAKLATQSDKDANFYLTILQELHSALYATNNTIIKEFGIIGTAFAKDDELIYFSGVATNKSVIDAEKSAIKNAKINAATSYINYLVDSINATTEELEDIDFIDAIGNFLTKDQVIITNKSGTPEVKAVLRVDLNIDKEIKGILSSYILQKRNSPTQEQQAQEQRTQAQQIQAQQTQAQQSQPQQTQAQQSQPQQTQAQQTQAQQTQAQQTQAQQTQAQQAQEQQTQAQQTQAQQTQAQQTQAQIDVAPPGNIATTVIESELNRNASKAVEASTLGAPRETVLENRNR